MNSLDQCRHKELKELLELYELGFMYDLWEKNPGNGNAYHNNDHQAIVALTAYRLATHESLDLPRRLEIALLFAGMFHDFDHTGDPSLPDSVNIERALKAWDKHSPFTGSPHQLVKTLISATHEDFVTAGISDLQLQYACEVIKEADFGYLAEPDRNLWFRKLAEELKQSVTEESTREFLASRKFRYLKFAL